jgi:hypothetical protein
MGMQGHRDDNSNSQFAMLALWAARRHEVPMALSLALLDPRYRSSQFPDGSWGYHLQELRSAKPSMTCVGLLGLGIGHGAAREAAAGKVLRANTILAADKFQAPSLQDPAIQRGLWALGRSIGNPTPQRSGLPMVNLYALWSVERVAMLYQLRTIGNKDWYGWGAEILVTNQLPDGSWDSDSYPGCSPTIDTCMALLFLKGNNLVQDLTDNLRPYIATADPGANE